MSLHNLKVNSIYPQSFIPIGPRVSEILQITPKMNAILVCLIASSNINDKILDPEEKEALLKSLEKQRKKKKKKEKANKLKLKEEIKKELEKTKIKKEVKIEPEVDIKPEIDSDSE